MGKGARDGGGGRKKNVKKIEWKKWTQHLRIKRGSRVSRHREGCEE